MADTTINTVKKEDPWTAFEPVIDDTGQEEEDPWAAFEPVIEEPEVVKTEVVNNATTSLDPAVQEEMDNRASMIEIVGIDPYNGEVVNENPTYMIPGIMDINEDVSAEFERLKTIYPEQFPEEFDVAGDKSFFGFGARKNNKVMGTAADKVSYRVYIMKLNYQKLQGQCMMGFLQLKKVVLRLWIFIVHTKKQVKRR